MPEYLIQVPAGLTTDGLLARRYLARFIDTFIIMFLVTLVIIVPASLLGFAPRLGAGIGGSVLIFALVLILWIGYGTLLESSRWQATLGKRIMGLRVYNSTGRPLLTMQAAARNVVKDGP